MVGKTDARTKTEVINLRMAPRVKEMLRLAAEHERRTLSNMIEVLVVDFCNSHRIVSPRTDAKQAPAQHPKSPSNMTATET